MRCAPRRDSLRCGRTDLGTPQRPLAVGTSCEGCGACCRVVTSPPFRRRFDREGEEAWERLGWERPDLQAELLAAEQARRAAGAPSFGSPCLWYHEEDRR